MAWCGLFRHSHCLAERMEAVFRGCLVLPLRCFPEARWITTWVGWPRGNDSGSGQNGARKADGKGRNDRNGESQILSDPIIRFMFISSDVWQNLHNHSWATATEVQAEAPPGILFGALRKAIKGGLQISPDSSCHSPRRPQYSNEFNKFRWTQTLRQVHWFRMHVDSSNPLMTEFILAGQATKQSQDVAFYFVHWFLGPISNLWTSSQKKRKAFIKKPWTDESESWFALLPLCVCVIWSQCVCVQYLRINLKIFTRFYKCIVCIPRTHHISFTVHIPASICRQWSPEKCWVRSLHLLA